MHGEKNFHCLQCGEGFCTQGNLNMHIKSRKSCTEAYLQDGKQIEDLKTPRRRKERENSDFNDQFEPKRQKISPKSDKIGSVKSNRRAIQENETKAAIDSITY